MRFKIVAVYPNPIGEFGGRFVVSTPFAGDVTFKLFDLRGELIFNGALTCPGPGHYEYFWGAVNNSGNKVAYGAYYLKARIEGSGRNADDQRWLTVLR